MNQDNIQLNAHNKSEYPPAHNAEFEVSQILY
jgi:hypothetical protein